MKKIKHLKPVKENNTSEIIRFPGYPLYPASEDIYSHFRKDLEINPEDTSEMKKAMDNAKVHTRNEKDFDDDFSGNVLDVPGAELDDIQENIGSEDEENNYYSLGGDDHNDLEEEKE
ncbi:hypothetical protein EMA8858_04106 [Emticicia aquatica]|uniref:Uncharacterized protein n=1 Tax=Emticicia aquatica TaxID=1681835 RepID=A0ABN8F3E0_9BACT|nr:hypothetical protein [Emticicia aquatica]CAH0997971.1 hypothetical protein EMA8858_04106 [Emticicia aquatica]